MPQYKIFLIGNTTLLPENESHLKFEKVKSNLEELGYIVINPIITQAPVNSCDAVFVLPGYEKCPSAKNILLTAFENKLDLYFQNQNDFQRLQVYAQYIKKYSA